MRKVLVADDEMIERKGIASLLMFEDYDLEILEAANGKEALELVKQKKPDILISDIKMPFMNGLELMDEVRKFCPDMGIIVITGYSDFSYAQSALKLLASDYILKPFGDGELEEAVKKVLEKRRSENKKGEGQRDELPGLVLNKGDKSKYVMEAVEYISTHYSDPELSVAMIAENLGISEGHLSHLFRKETDFTFLSYLTQCRMRAAKKLLKDHRYKIYEIAEMVGYKDITYFSVTFKKLIGVSPSEYQDRYRD